MSQKRKRNEQSERDLLVHLQTNIHNESQTEKKIPERLFSSNDDWKLPKSGVDNWHPDSRSQKNIKKCTHSKTCYNQIIKSQRPLNFESREGKNLSHTKEPL